MTIKEGVDILDELKVRKPYVLLFTGNSYVNSRGELVMGRGFAKQIKERYPFISVILGNEIKKRGNKYGLIIIRSENKLGFNIGVFQVKYHFKDNADLSLIEFSTNCLFSWIRRNNLINSSKEIWMNFPGIGWGHLSHKEEEIRRILSVLPDNVIVFKK